MVTQGRTTPENQTCQISLQNDLPPTPVMTSLGRSRVLTGPIFQLAPAGKLVDFERLITPKSRGVKIARKEEDLQVDLAV